MNQLQVWQVWLPPMLAVIGSLIVVVLAAWLNTRTVIALIEGQNARIDATGARIDAMGAKMGQQIAELKQQMAEFELRLTKQLLELSNRVARLEEQRGIVYTPGD